MADMPAPSSGTIDASGAVTPELPVVPPIKRGRGRPKKGDITAPSYIRKHGKPPALYFGMAKLRRGERPFMVDLIDGFVAWVRAGNCFVQHLQTNKTVPMELKPLQLRLLAEMRRQAEAGQPIRIVGLKSRKGGFSTVVEAFCYFWVKSQNDRYCLCLAHTEQSTKDLFRLTNRIAINDPDFKGLAKKGSRGREFEAETWQESESGPRRPKNNAREIEFKHHNSVFATRTGGGHYVGSSATIHGLHISELAKWDGSETVVRDQMDSLFGSVPDHAETMIVIESTANESDTSGEFERRFKYAQAQAQAAKDEIDPEGSSGFSAFFSGWNEEPAYSLPGKRVLFTEEEKSLIDTFGVTADQLRWRRWKIKTSFSGDELRFRREFPISPDEAFQVARGKIFPSLRIEKHHLLAAPNDLAVRGYRFYRGVDFGGADPFVCLWVAYKDGHPNFTVDTYACPETWRELTGYRRDPRGRPLDRDNHAIDALRYAVVHFNMTGHVHVYRELYVPDTASRGIDITQLAATIREKSFGEDMQMTVADKSRPDSIVLLSNQGVPACPFKPPESVQVGQIEDGIARLNSLMLATVPLVHLPPPTPYVLQQIAQRRNSEFDYGVTSELSVAMGEYQFDNPSIGGDPIFGGAFL